MNRKKTVSGIAEKIVDIATGITDIIFPRVCTVCGTTLLKGEDLMCVKCLMELPATNIHRRHPNTIHDRLATTVTRVEKCASMFWYIRESPYSNLIKDAKYHGRPSVGRKLAATYAAELMASGFFDDMDAIIPIPIPFVRLLTRGYNQTAHIARGLSATTGLPVYDNLHSRWLQRSQTRRNARDRQRQSEGRFRVDAPEVLRGKHLLLVDDVITTGATMTAALEAVKHAVGDVRLSVLSLALTQE